MVPRRPVTWFVLAFVVFNLNLRSIGVGDTIPASLMPFSIVLDHQINLDRFYPWYVGNFPETMYVFHPTKQHVYSVYPVALPLLLTPLYYPVIVLCDVKSWPVETVITFARGLEKLFASGIAAAAVALFFALARRLTDQRMAAGLTLLFAFATPMWTISSQALWQQGPGTLMILASLYWLHRSTQDERAGRAALIAGLFAGLALAIRLTNVSFLLAGSLFLLLPRPRWKPLFLYGVWPGVIGAAVAVYNLRLFGTLQGFYASSTFRGDPLWGLAGVLVSPSHGLLVFAPFFAFVPLALVAWWRGRPRFCPPLVAVCLAFVALQFAIVASWPGWHGGWCYGPRLLTEIMPALLLLLIPGRELLVASRPARVVFAAAAAAAIAVQGVGAFCYPRGDWDGRPVAIHDASPRLWEWRDNPIIRTAAAGVCAAPFAPLHRRTAFSTASPVTLRWAGGFHGPESSGLATWHWCAAGGDLCLINLSGAPRDVVLEMVCATAGEGPATLRLESALFREECRIDRRGTLVTRRLTLPAGTHVVHFACDAPPLEAPGEPRTLVFRVIDCRADVLP